MANQFVSRKSTAAIYSNIKVFISFRIILVRHSSNYYLAELFPTDSDSFRNTRMITENKLEG
jgi:hypothetical protein